MPRPFPDRFDPQDWQGPRARAHPRREDAFQQLIGQAVQEIHGLHAHVATTAGRDGSIDIYIEGDLGGMRTFKDWPLPLILECKDHDEGGRDLMKNVQTGWSTVRERLARLAKAGWPGAYAPWNSARTYLYCLSSRLPSPAARIELQNEIEEFFRGLPPQNRPPLDAVKVLDWSGLRGWLDTLPRVADAWLGTEAPSVVGHKQFVEGLAGFRRYLLPEELPYVAPDPGEASHPDRLFERLAQQASPGVLLVGVGGVGKTRLAVEAASRAVAAGWRVLHAGAGDASLEFDVLASAVLAQGSQTLVVLDYIDQMHRLDPGALRHRLLPEARRRGQTIALLATARPGAPVLDHPEWGGLLAIVALRPTEEQVAAITERMIATLAPRAEAILGKERLRQLCGRRPILTLFLARELERRAHEDRLSREQVTDLREGDLLRWLRLRLEENGIMVPVTRRLVPAEPEYEVVAAAAVLAAAPLSPADLFAVAAVALGERSDLAQPLVENLAAFGWLEPSPGEWSTAHDVVADEVLEQVLRLRPGAGVRPRTLHVLLSAGLKAPRTLGRLALALRRLILASADEPSFAENVMRSARDWLQFVETELAAVLAAADPDEAGYALGSVIAGPPWDAHVFENWDVLVGPWLHRWREESAARHLLYIGLRRKESASASLVEDACAWLRIHGLDLEASFVLAPLLERTEGRVEAIEFALAWLAQFPLEPEAGFVLHSLLGRPDLGGRSAEAIDRGLAWLAQFPLEPAARFVLHPLLGYPDLGERSAEAIDRGLAWLAQFPLEPEAGFVLPPLLGRADLEGRSAEAIDRGLAWLARYSLEKDAGFVLPMLLERQDLEDSQRGTTVSFALDWLDIHYATGEPDFILKNLFKSKLQGNDFDRCVRLALQRAEALPLDFAESSFLLEWVLSAKGLTPPEETRAVQRGLAWCGLQPFSPDAKFVLKPMLRRKSLSDEAWLRAASLAIAWLRNTPHAPDRDFLLISCLTRPDLLSDPDLDFLRQDILAWCQAFPEAENAVEKLQRALYRAIRGRPGEEDPRLLPPAPIEDLRQWLENPAKGPQDELLEREISRVGRTLEAGQSGSCGYYLTLLLPLAARWGNTAQQERVKELARRMLAHPTFETRHRTGFAHASFRLVEGNTWPDADAGRQVLHELGLTEEETTPSVRTENLFHWLKHQATQPPDEFLTEGIAQAGQLLGMGLTGSAGYYLAPLLPLIHRWGSEAQKAEVHGLTGSLLSHPQLQPQQHAGFVKACLQLLDRGAWADADFGRETLHQLGVTGVRSDTPIVGAPTDSNSPGVP